MSQHRGGLSEHTARYSITKPVYAEEFETAPDAIAGDKQLRK
jgi:hypothetical protein